MTLTSKLSLSYHALFGEVFLFDGPASFLKVLLVDHNRHVLGLVNRVFESTAEPVCILLVVLSEQKIESLDSLIW